MFVRRYIHAEIDADSTVARFGKKRKRKRKRKHCKCAMHTYSRVIDYAMSRDIFYLTVNYTDDYEYSKQQTSFTFSPRNWRQEFSETVRIVVD